MRHPGCARARSEASKPLCSRVGARYARTVFVTAIAVFAIAAAPNTFARGDVPSRRIVRALLRGYAARLKGSRSFCPAVLVTFGRLPSPERAIPARRASRIGPMAALQH